ncbi:MAG: VWA domain-containing protein [Acidobacteria bacterium]|nr:VWA domain-containing protein [Acidobacteriota bacterium]
MAWPSGIAGQDVVFKSDVKVVIINVTVTARDGQPLDKLSKDDFILLEDGKPQQIRSLDFQRLGTDPLPPIAPTFAQRQKPTTPPRTVTAAERDQLKEQYQDRRLMVMLFDLSSMQPAEQFRALEAAQKFVSTQLSASDVVSVMTFSTSLKTVLDFTADRELLLSTIKGIRVGEGSEQSGVAETGADAEDQSGAFVADDTEFNIFNTDRKLAALEDASRKLAPYPQKKALVYFSSGVEKTGVDNQSQLRSTVAAAVRANVSFYPIDARGLSASAPGGDASQAGASGTALASGRGQRQRSDSFNNQQETLFSLASDTGGKALLDGNDLTVGLREVQKSIDSYYILSYVSTNIADDGRYRKVQVKLAPGQAALRAKLDYRQGYFAASTFKTMTGSDKETQLQQALASESGSTELPLAVEIDYFRLSKTKYFVPVTVRISGAALAFRNKGSKAATELDFIAQFKDSKGRVSSLVRDTIPLKIDQATAGEVARKQIQYDTGFTLTPGKYVLRFIARENGEGKTGTFETNVIIPELAAEKSLRLSSVVLSNQRQPAKEQLAGASNKKKLVEQNPLVSTDGQKLVPNVTRAFRSGQTLFAYLELYDPAAPESAAGPGGGGPAGIVGVSASLSLLKDDRKVAESAPSRAFRVGTRGENAVPLRLQLPLKDLKPGTYICQVNVIDEFGKKFAFPRTSMIIVPEEAAKPAAQP